MKKAQDTVRKYLKILRNPHFWGVAVTTLVCSIFLYSHEISFLRGVETCFSLGMTRHAVCRILFLAPITYAAFVFGAKVAIATLAIALALMLPQIIFISPYPQDALFETCTVVGVGGLTSWWLDFRRREIGRREQALLRLETVRRQLQSYVDEIKKNEKRLSAVHSVSTAVNQSLMIEEVIDVACNKIEQVIDVDAIMLFFLNEKRQWLELKAHRGMTKQFASAVDQLKVGEGFNGWVAQTGEPYFVEDATEDPRLTRQAVRQEGIRTFYIVPLKSKDKVIGTLCIARRVLGEYDEEEKDLLALIGTELGVAAEKALLFQQRQEYADQISQAHEEERKRIARELHDDTIQTMVAISRHLDTLTSEDSLLPKEFTESLETIRKDIDKSLARTRRFIQDLRPPTLEYLGLVPALRELASQVQDESGIRIELKLAGPEKHFTTEESLLIYRIVQEAVRNVWRHSGATFAGINMKFDNGQTTVAITDNGKGFESKTSAAFIESGQLGLMGMKERSHLLDGTVDIISRPNHGTTVTLTVHSRCSDQQEERFPLAEH